MGIECLNCVSYKNQLLKKAFLKRGLHSLKNWGKSGDLLYGSSCFPMDPTGSHLGARYIRDCVVQCIPFLFVWELTWVYSP